MAIEFGNGTSLSNAMVCSWRIHTGFTGHQNPINVNWERADNTLHGNNYANVLTESSGVFTFASTGWYVVTWEHYFQSSVDSVWNEMQMALSSNSGSNWQSVGYAQAYSISGNTRYVIASKTHSFKISDTSTQRMRFGVNVNNTSVTTAGSTSQQFTGFTIAKVADV